MENQLLQFRQKFIEDAGELIDSLESDLMILEAKPNDNELIESVFRCMHTLKGVSSMYGFDNVAEITHQVENVYDLIRNNEIVVNQHIIQTTLNIADYIRTLLNADDSVLEKLQQIRQQLLDPITQILNDAGFNSQKIAKKKKSIQKEGQFCTWQIAFVPEESIIMRGINLISTFSDLFEMGSCQITQNEAFEETNKFIIFLYTDKLQQDIEDVLLFIIDDCKITKIGDFDIFDENSLEKHKTFEIKSDETQDKKSGDNLQEGEKKDKKKLAFNISEFKTNGKVKSRISVEAAKLDELMYLVSELITSNSQLVLASKNKVYNPIRPIFEKIDKLSKQFRNNTLNLRLVPLNGIVQKFQRLVHDLSLQQDKDIEMITQGTETELDKNTIDALADPLMHLIRNCIDHGIEMPETRKSQNKPEKGTVKITAYHSGSFVFIQVQDDGQGIDVEKIKQKAIEKKLISDDATLTDNEAFDLIFLPGFSTAESLTQLSGRGVGMDVVRRKITELRGQIEITSQKGLGTTFNIKLHQTITILDTMLFQIDDMYMLAPLIDIEECNLIDAKILESNKSTGTVPFHNKLIPYIDLYKLYGLKKPINNKLKLIVINKQENRFAIAADIIIGEHQAVLKTMGTHIKKQENIAGASILGDGNLAFLLDTNALQQLNRN